MYLLRYKAFFYFLLLCIIAPAMMDAQQKIWFQEDFSNNERGWLEKKTETYEAGIDSGYYSIKKLVMDEKRLTFWLSVFIDPDKDFDIICKLKQEAGLCDKGYGLIWGGYDIGSYYCFNISSRKGLHIGYYYYNEYFPVKESRDTTAIKPTGAINALKIARRGERMYYFINESQVAETNVGEFFGNNLGFELNSYMSVKVDKLTVIQDNVINVAPGLIKGLKKFNLGPNVNSEFDEIQPLISPDGRTLYFTVKNCPYNTNGYADDIWYSKIRNDSVFEIRKNMGSPLNNSGFNFLISVSPDNNTLLIGNTYNPDGSPKASGFSLSHKTVTGWSIPQDVIIEDYYNYSDWIECCLSSAQNVLVLSILRKDTYGERDLYVCFRKDNGKWSSPLNLGKDINTAGDDITPFLAADGVTLYFSSDGRPGFGSNDIFISRRLDETWTKWSEPLNLGNEINSPKWDAYYSVPASGKYAYVVSSEKSYGKADIFRLALPPAIRPKPVVLLYGKVIDSKTGKPVDAKITYRDLVSDKEVGIASSEPETGNYIIILPAGRRYSFLAKHDNYVSVSDHFDVSRLNDYEEIQKDLLVTPVEEGQTIRLNNIFFDSGKSILRSESFPELDRVVSLLTMYPGIIIEIAGHTDNVGIDDDNLKLSQDRADAVRNYLLQKNIKPERVTAKGYGETQPQTTNDTEEGKQLNRRVEFTIIKE
jgi:outer membrane protein OmpA-like peptidoglycan-associated protein